MMTLFGALALKKAMNERGARDIVHHNWSGDSEIEKMMSTMQKALGIDPESKS